ncbi:MAG: SAP domain-containing protein [Candidatus Thermoplasmatota archaeon]|nr:SAP domain-containing protein [Candidatus Thermoplasmatota archaeon]
MQRNRPLERSTKGVTTHLLPLLLVCAFLAPILSTSNAVADGSGTVINVDVANCPSIGIGTPADPFCEISVAVAASSTGDTISVAAGTYVLSTSIEVEHDLTIQGANSATSALQRQAGATSESIIDIRDSYGGFFIHSSNVSISGFDISGNESTRWGVYIAGNEGDLSNIEISNNMIHGMARKASALQSSSWGILTDAVGSGPTLNTLSGLHIHGNNIYDIGGHDDSIGLGISLHEVRSSVAGGGALIENNRFANIHDGVWMFGPTPVPTPGMGVFAHEQTGMYPGDYQGGVTLQNNQYESLDIGATLQLTDGGHFNESSSNFQSVEVYMVNVEGLTTVDENSLAPFARTTGSNETISDNTSIAYFASPSVAIHSTLVGSENTSHSVQLSSGTFDENLSIIPTSSQGNLHVGAISGAEPVFTGGALIQSNYMMNDITVEGVTLQGEGSSDVAFSVQSPMGISNLAIRNVTVEGNGDAKSGIVASGLRGVIEIEDNHFNDLDGSYVFSTTPDDIDSGAGQIYSLSFSGNTVENSDGQIQIKPVFGSIPQVVMVDNEIRNSGTSGQPMVTITNSGTVSVEDNAIENLTSEMGVELYNVMFVTALDNDMSGMDVAFSIDQSSMTLADATFEGNSFSEINDLAIEVPNVHGADVVVEDNWFGTVNMSEIMLMIDGDVSVEEQLNSPPGIDSDGDGWADEFDLCEGHNDAIDVDQDGLPDGCDSLIDSDGDLVSDATDNCFSIPNNDQLNHDQDLLGDACDEDDDNDQMRDEFDTCPRGYPNWVPTITTDYDNDGCSDFVEDTDDDNDGVLDITDLCPGPNSHWGWTSDNTTDHDGDGCRDTIEDNDNDNDGSLNSADSCPEGYTDWHSSKLLDYDLDGCIDSFEDDDDDADGIIDDEDDCPKERVTENIDKNGDGCIDSVTETTSFVERLLSGDSVALAIVIIPLILIFVVIGRGLVIGERKHTLRRVEQLISSAETAQQLRTLSTQISEMMLAKAITDSQYDILLGQIAARQEEFGKETISKLDEAESELETVLAEAISLGLTTEAAVNRMRRHVESGRFSPDHYLKLWNKRLNEHSTPSAVEDAVNEVAEEAEKEEDEGEPEDEQTELPSASQLSRLKKAELVDLAKERGLPHSGTKADIIARLTEEE